MTRRSTCFLKLVFILNAFLISVGTIGSEVNLPTHTQLSQAEDLFTRLFKQIYTPETQNLAKSLGFSWQENDENVHLKDPLKTGIGEYFFNKQDSHNIVLQAPHRYHDKYTGSIAKKIFKLGSISSIALNTLPRYTPTQNNTYFDFSRLKISMHTAYTLAFISQKPEGKVVQLHGFNAQKRRTSAAQATQIILSNGHNLNTVYLQNLQNCFEKNNWKSALYPSQVKELGATKNPVGALLRSMGNESFHHVELNFESRKDLVNQSARRSEFLACLIEGLE